MHQQLMETIQPKILEDLIKKDIEEFNTININALRKFLKKNKETEAGKQFSFDALLAHPNEQLISEYKKNIPLTTYQDYEGYIQRILNGEANILGCGQAGFISMTG